MGMPHATERWTAEMVRALPDDGNRYEVVDGELLVTPAPRLPHQEAVTQLILIIRPYVDRHGIGCALMSPADIEFDPHTLVQPDFFVAPLVSGRRPREWLEIKQLLLAVEVLSPSTAPADRTVKRRRYQRAGVLEYWLIDLDARLIERWHRADERPEIVTDSLTWQPDSRVPGLTLDLPRFFASVLEA